MTVTRPGVGSSMPDEAGMGWHETLVVGASPDRSGLAIWTDQSRNRLTLRLRGRLCSDTVRLLDTHVDLIGCHTCDEVILDLSDLDTMDEVGARVVVGLSHYVAGRGGRFAIEGAVASTASMIARAEVELAS